MGYPMNERRRWWLILGGILVGGGLLLLAGQGLSRARVTGDTPRQRIESICRIADSKPWGAIDAIARAAAEDPDAGVRAVAVTVLAKFGPGEKRETVMQATRDEAPAVRAAAAQTLAMFRDELAIRRLAEMAGAEAQPEVRLAAVDALRDCATVEAGQALFALMDSTDAKVRVKAFESLMNLLNTHWEQGQDPWPLPQWKRLHSRLMAKMNVAPPEAHDGKVVNLVPPDEEEKRQ